MIWLYRLQQRLSITRREGIAVLTLTAILVTGLTVRHVQTQQVPSLAADTLVTSPDRISSPSSPAQSSPPSTPQLPVDLNSAPQTALQALPGIGPALSERIIKYRSTQRPFQRVEELKRVRGIGPKTLADLQSKVTVQHDQPTETPSSSGR